jgi:hypothetical protein
MRGILHVLLPAHRTLQRSTREMAALALALRHAWVFSIRVCVFSKMNESVGGGCLLVPVSMLHVVAMMLVVAAIHGELVTATQRCFGTITLLSQGT